MVWTRIRLLFGCFGSGPPKALDASFWCLTFHSGPPKVLEAHSTLNAFRSSFPVSHSFCCLTFHSGPPKVLEAHSTPNAFRRQRFGIVRGRCFAWFGHESCCCSAVSEAIRQRLWTLVFDVWHFIPARQRFWKPIQHLSQHLLRFVGNVSALFVVAVSHGFGTNPAAVRLFRKRSAKGFGR